MKLVLLWFNPLHIISPAPLGGEFEPWVRARYVLALTASKPDVERFQQRLQGFRTSVGNLENQCSGYGPRSGIVDKSIFGEVSDFMRLIVWERGETLWNPAGGSLLDSVLGACNDIRANGVDTNEFGMPDVDFNIDKKASDRYTLHDIHSDDSRDEQSPRRPIRKSIASNNSENRDESMERPTRSPKGRKIRLSSLGRGTRSTLQSGGSDSQPMNVGNLKSDLSLHPDVDNLADEIETMAVNPMSSSITIAGDESQNRPDQMDTFNVNKMQSAITVAGTSSKIADADANEDTFNVNHISSSITIPGNSIPLNSGVRNSPMTSNDGSNMSIDGEPSRRIKFSADSKTGSSNNSNNKYESQGSTSRISQKSNNSNNKMSRASSIRSSLETNKKPSFDAHTSEKTTKSGSARSSRVSTGSNLKNSRSSRA